MRSKRSKTRPPRVRVAKDGRRYIKTGKRRKYIKSDLRTNALIRFLIDKIVNKKRRRRKRKQKKVTSNFEELEADNRRVRKYQKLQEEEDKLEAEKLRLLLQSNQMGRITADQNALMIALNARPMALPPLPPGRPTKGVIQPPPLPSQPPPDSKARGQILPPPLPSQPPPKSKSNESKSDNLLARQLQQQLESDAKSNQIALQEAREAKEAESKKAKAARLDSELYKFLEVQYVETLRGILGRGYSRTNKKELIDTVSEGLTYDDKEEVLNSKTPIADMTVIFSKKPAKKKARKKIGQGSTGRGSTNTELQQALEKYDWFKGIYMSDFKNIPISQEPFGFIMNLDKEVDDGSHWVAVWIDPDESIEYYDSLADPPSRDFQKRIKRVVDKINPDVYLKFKYNKIKRQSDGSDLCGYHAMLFLLQRAKGLPWKFCSGYTDITDHQADKLRKKVSFGYI